MILVWTVSTHWSPDPFPIRKLIQAKQPVQCGIVCKITFVNFVLANPRVLIEDLDSEQQLRRRVEREKQDFQMQVGDTSDLSLGNLTNLLLVDEQNWPECTIYFFSQIISLSERLTEAEGGCESQADLNRRREAEMAKLRKLLEDVHTESEQSIHMMKKKHQESMMEMQARLTFCFQHKGVVNIGFFYII